MENLISCYQEQFGSEINLFIAPDPISIFWSDFSLIQADLECLEILLDKDPSWKFFINQVMMVTVLSQKYPKRDWLRPVFKNFTMCYWFVLHSSLLSSRRDGNS